MPFCRGSSQLQDQIQSSALQADSLSSDCKEIQPVHPKGDHQSWVLTGRTDVEAETQILWPPDAKS